VGAREYVGMRRKILAHIMSLQKETNSFTPEMEITKNKNL
jgi:hypothetical protein